MTLDYRLSDRRTHVLEQGKIIAGHRCRTGELNAAYRLETLFTKLTNQAGRGQSDVTEVAEPFHLTTRDTNCSAVLMATLPMTLSSHYRKLVLANAQVKSFSMA